ncbi:MAG: helix-turn-helix domain-containing protein [Ruthenibacterium lactatiformans]|uniref:helix-turn-helix domain-containing protein n=1 Tax=Hominenteromicrobium sp. TaxID=3073581 RepID=UPI0039947657
MKYYISSDLSLSMLSVRALKLFNFLQAKANGKTNSSFWSVPRMAQEMGLSERTVQRASQELVRKAFVEIIPRYDENGRQQSNIYKIVVPQELPHEANTFTDDVDQLKGRELQVYMYIRRRCGSRGYRVSRQEIAAELNISRSTVSRITRRLAAGGWIDKAYAGRPFGGGRGWNRYAISRIRMNARCRIIFCRLVLQAAAQETAHFAARISFGVGKSVTPLTKLKGIIKNLLNKGVIGIKYFLKAMCRREEQKRGLVENGVLRGKVRAFFNRYGGNTCAPPEKQPGAPPPFRSVQQILSARQGAQNT